MNTHRRVIKVLLLSLLMVLPFWQSAYAAEEAPPAVEQALMVNINTASAEQLSEQLTGIGEKRAAAIIAYRDANGPFSSIEQLLEVKGVGEKVLDKNRQRLTLE